MFKVSAIGLSKLYHFHFGIGEEVLGTAQHYGIARATEGIGPFGSVDVKHKSGTEEQFPGKRVDLAFQDLGQRSAPEFSPCSFN